MRQSDYLMNPFDPPDATIVGLEKILSPLKRIDVSPRAIHSSGNVAGVIRPDARVTALRRLVWPAIAAASVVMLLSAVATYGRAMGPWTVATMPAGARFATEVPELRTVRPGDVITTDSVSSARLNVGLIGRTKMDPGSRVRVVHASASQYRLALEKGVMHARIWAPPRFFLVETKNALAVDLGCAYTLRANPDGSVWMKVESGEVELVSARSRVRVPAGNTASIHADGSSGLPVPVKASARLVNAVSSFEKNPAGPVDSILEAADSSTTIVLWHLLERVSADDRGRVFDRLSSVSSFPKGVTRPDIVKLDSEALEKLRGSLTQSWSTEAVPLWKRWWRAAFSLARS